MTGEIINGICKEIQSLFAGTGTQVMRDTKFKIEDMPVYSGSLVLINIGNSPDHHQAMGGWSCVFWELIIKSYFYDENSILEDDQEYNTNSYDILDTIRKHFGLEDWLTSEMVAITETYGLKLSFNGISEANELAKQGGGLIPGYALTYDTTSFDSSTGFVEQKTFTTTNIKGVTFLDYDDTIEYNWLIDCKAFLATVNDYTNITTASIGDRYYVSSVNRIYTVKTISTTTHKPVTSDIYNMVLNDLFLSLDTANYVFLWNGTSLEQKDMLTKV